MAEVSTMIMLQKITSPKDPYIVGNYDPTGGKYPSGCLTGFPGKRNGPILAAFSSLLKKGEMLRMYQIDIHAGDFSPVITDDEDLRNRRAVAIESRALFMLEKFGNIYNQAFTVYSIHNFFNNDPEKINVLWDHEDFQKCNCISWRRDFTILNKNYTVLLYSVRRSPSAIVSVKCIQNAAITKDDVEFVYPEKAVGAEANIQDAN